MYDGVYFGTAGWSYDDWYGSVYPPVKSPEFRPLEYLIKYVDTIEINSTFYRPPSKKTAQAWAKAALPKENFLFTVKLWDVFTHKRSNLDSRSERIFKDSIEPIQASHKLGALLIQFPASFIYSKENLQYILELSKKFKDYDPCVELRNIDWSRDLVLKNFADSGVGFVNIDQPRSRINLNMTDISTSNMGYLRLHGRNSAAWFDKNAGRDKKYDYLYDDIELDELCSLAKRISQKVERTFIIANNHFAGSAFSNALQMKARIKGEKVVIPETAALRFQELKKISSKIDKVLPPKQTDLFPSYRSRS